MGKNWFGRSIVAIIIFFLIVISSLATMYTNYLWFGALGFSKIFLVTLFTKIKLFVIAGVLFFLFALLNVWVSSKIVGVKKTFSVKVKFLIVLIISFFVGLGFSSGWFKVLQFFNQTPFNIQDPIFLKDVSFYVFSLPFYSFVLSFLITTVVITTLLVVIDYVVSFASQKVKPTPTITNSLNQTVAMASVPTFSFANVFSKKKVVLHVGFLAFFFFALLAMRHYFSRFSIMYSQQGIVVGAGYSDIVAFLPMIKILMILAIGAAILSLVWIFYVSKKPKLRKRHILMYALFVYVLFAFIGPTLVPQIVQSLVVSPNEINLEKPYIENNIKFTRLAYGLDDVQEEIFPVSQDLTSEMLSEEKETIDNVRILDWRPLTKTYKQTQEIRLYYDLSGIDIDRYTIDGKYTQVMLAPRELDQRQITANAQTWVNLHMVYTHGFGIVMSPVNKVTKQGLPDYFIKDIPPIYTVDEPSLRVDKPQIYYGEKDNEFVLVNTNTQEFDYPKGNANEYISYDGKGGVLLDSFFKKVMLAIRFTDIKILLSSDITDESKIMFTRNIVDRIEQITPFISLDDDPYMVLNEGRVFWIVDGYTTTGNYPYSEKYGPINYVRNSVKIVVDAYNGDVTYYVMDLNDPIIMTYAKIFPKQFNTFENMPEGLKAHIRYPEDLFKIQSHIYSTYHMDDIKVFYNKEDAWQIPNEVYGVGEQVKVEPYYIIMKLPDVDKEEFVLMTSFTPIKKDNMVAWMAARADGDNYGKLVLYKFPKDKLVYGPLQIEARIDQDSEISQQLTLWSQQGSRVTRGNLLVIPIQNSILYVEPLYIQAETGQLPELKRVIVSDGDRVVMEESFTDALEVLFGIAKEKDDGSDEEVTLTIADAQAYYDLIQEAMKEGDWAGIGANLDLLGDVLGSLE